MLLRVPLTLLVKLPFLVKMMLFYGSAFAVPTIIGQVQGLDTPVSILIAGIGTAIAGTVVVVVRNFLEYLDKQNKVMIELKDMVIKLQDESHRHAAEMADKFIKRQEDTQKSFQEHIQKLTEGQNQVLGETVMAVQSLESSLNIVRQDVQVLLVTVKSPAKMETTIQSHDQITNQHD
jgi:flagellar hook-basal body complex protein FliE